MEQNGYTYTGAGEINLLDYSTAAPKNVPKDSIIKQLDKNKQELEHLLDKLYAAKQEGMIILLQSLDGAGKFSLIKNLFSCFNAVGLHVYFFDEPSREELRHDLLWRFHQTMPKRGEIALLNHSYYEDIVQCMVHKSWQKHPLPERITAKGEQAFFEQSYEHIRSFEHYLQESGYRVVKLFLNVSEDKQVERYIDRMQKPSRHWKFSSADIVARGYRPDYIAAYARSFAATATEQSPWHIIPADHKWYTQYVVSDILLNVFHDIAPKYPAPNEKEQLQIPIYLDRLTREMQNDETKL